MQPRGFSINFDGADAGTYVVYMAETILNAHLNGGAVALHGGAELAWTTGVWSLTITDDSGNFNVYTAPSPAGSIVPTNPGDWTLVGDGGNTNLAFTVYVP